MGIKTVTVSRDALAALAERSREIESMIGVVHRSILQREGDEHDFSDELFALQNLRRQVEHMSSELEAKSDAYAARGERLSLGAAPDRQVEGSRQ